MAHPSVRSAAQLQSGATDEQRRGGAGGADISLPDVCLLSNGRYNVMLTHAGSGYSSCNGLDVTRWREEFRP